MEPFSIVCTSCAARLKVTKASAVGQILSCPKCGTMIEVTTPEGWVAPVADSDISKSSQLSRPDLDPPALNPSGSIGEFDDIEDILSGTPTPSVEKNKPTKPKPSQRQPSQRQPRQRNSSATSTANTNSDRPQQQRQTSARTNATSPSQQRTPSDQRSPANQPLLPNEQWTSDETRKRKRLVTTIVGSIGLLILIGAIIAAITSNLSKPDPKVATNDTPVADTPTAETPPNDPAEIEPTTTQSPETESPATTDLLNDVVAPNPDTNPATPELEIGEAPPVLSGIGATPPIQTATPTVEPTETAETPRPNTSPQSPVTAQSPANVGPLDINPQTSAATDDIGLVEAFDNDLGDLTGLLESRGTSLLEIKDLTAAIRNRQVVGLPKYIVTQTDPLKINVEENLLTPIGGLKFDSAPLTKVIRTVSAISGIPITIDVHSIMVAGKSSNPDVSATISETDVAGALNQILTPLGMSHLVQETGLSVGVFDSQDMTEASFDIPAVPGINNDGKKRFLAVIQLFIDPASWERQNDPATISLVDDQIKVRCTQEAQDSIRDLLSRLNASLALSQDANNAEALKAIRSRWESIQANLNRNPGLIHGRQLEIGSFLNKLHAKSGVNILVDWQNVVKEKWTPRTLLPGNLIEQTVEGVATQLARSMNLTILATDENTLVITTFAHAAKTADLEVYPLAKLLAGKLNSNHLLRLVTESLGTQLQSEKVRFLLEPNCQCLIVSAPQSLQRQIKALLDRLDEI